MGRSDSEEGDDMEDNIIVIKKPELTIRDKVRIIIEMKQTSYTAPKSSFYKKN
jgi:hypothetical protein